MKPVTLFEEVDFGREATIDEGGTRSSSLSASRPPAVLTRAHNKFRVRYELFAEASRYSRLSKEVLHP